MSKLRIVLADDHETVREGLKMIVNAQDDMEVVGFAGDGREAVARAQELLPDVLVMDISMPKLNGLEVLQYFCLLAGPNGDQLVLTYTMKPADAQKLDTRDLNLLRGVTFSRHEEGDVKGR